VAQGLDIPILDVSAILAQMQRDGIGARLLGHQGGLQGLGVAGAAHLAQGGDMVDVDAEQDGVDGHGLSGLQG
jgi:hypothetical protein